MEASECERRAGAPAADFARGQTWESDSTLYTCPNRGDNRNLALYYHQLPSVLSVPTFCTRARHRHCDRDQTTTPLDSWTATVQTLDGTRTTAIHTFQRLHSEHQRVSAALPLTGINGTHPLDAQRFPRSFLAFFLASMSSTRLLSIFGAFDAFRAFPPRPASMTLVRIRSSPFCASRIPRVAGIAPNQSMLATPGASCEVHQDEAVSSGAANAGEDDARVLDGATSEVGGKKSDCGRAAARRGASTKSARATKGDAGMSIVHSGRPGGRSKCAWVVASGGRVGGHGRVWVGVRM